MKRWIKVENLWNMNEFNSLSLFGKKLKETKIYESRNGKV